MSAYPAFRHREHNSLPTLSVVGRPLFSSSSRPGASPTSKSFLVHPFGMKGRKKGVWHELNKLQDMHHFLSAEASDNFSGTSGSNRGFGIFGVVGAVTIIGHYITGLRGM